MHNSLIKDLISALVGTDVKSEDVIKSPALCSGICVNCVHEAIGTFVALKCHYSSVPTIYSSMMKIQLGYKTPSFGVIEKLFQMPLM